ncbi:MAG: response regulator transcription factor [Anaerolineaceae bacterium]|nr:response regulator transcription factor [Anaerolineaceae bacterium]
MIQVIVCDDQEIVREGLKTILNAHAEIEVIATAMDGIDLLEKMELEQPDLILMDLKMPSMNGVQATQRVRQKYPQVQILVLTTYDDDEWLFDALRSGAAGYLLKDTPSSELIEAIQGTVAGKNYLDPAVAGKVMTNLNFGTNGKTQKTNIDLSERDLEILQLMGQGLSNADIARTLFLSEGTIRNYTSTIFTKLGVADRTQAVIAALRFGLIHLE